jgi:hypothetical protein
VPFDTDPDWPKPLQDALTAYRTAWRAKMDEVNACIAANAELEELVDKPEEAKGVVRVTGPFTMEGVIAVESGLRSLPFPRPARLKKNETWRVAIKVIDPRGNEGLRVVTIPCRYGNRVYRNHDCEPACSAAEPRSGAGRASATHQRVVGKGAL